MDNFFEEHPIVGVIMLIFAAYGFIVFMSRISPCTPKYGCYPSGDADYHGAWWQ